MDKKELRTIIREELEKALFQCHFLVSYDISKLNSNLKTKLPDKINELGGEMKNESLYCFSGGEERKSEVISEIKLLLKKENHSVNETIIYIVTANDNKLIFQQIQI